MILELTCRLIAHGRMPCVAISMICRRIWSGSGRPLMKTPPSWLTRPWPARSQSVTITLPIFLLGLPISASCSACRNMIWRRCSRNKKWTNLTLLICESSIEVLMRFDHERMFAVVMIRRCYRHFILRRGVNEVDKSSGERESERSTGCCANWLKERVVCL